MLSMQNLILIGPMGAGKTTVGRKLARLTERRFVDADHEIERRAGVDIPYIFEREGEAGFRLRERQVIQELCADHDNYPQGLVLATGGGAVLDADSRRLMRENGTVIYLQARAETLYQRTKQSGHRPLLQVANPLAKIEEILAAREALYIETAHLCINTEAMPLKHLAHWLADELQQGRI